MRAQIYRTRRLASHAFRDTLDVMRMTAGQSHAMVTMKCIDVSYEP